MYYWGKLFQAAGLTVIAVDFVRNFPAVMNRKVLTVGIILFTVGWVINYFLLKK